MDPYFTSTLPTRINFIDTENTSDTDTAKPLIYFFDGPYLDAVNDAIFKNNLLPSLIYVCILLLIGIPGNILVIYVYLLKWNKSTSRVFILALGLYDFVNCMTSMTMEVALILNFLKFDYPVLCKVSRFITATINSGSTFVLVAIAVDRFRRICRIHKSYINTTQAKFIVAGSALFAVATSWPALFLYGTRTFLIPAKGAVVVGKTCLIEDAMVETIFPFIFALFLLGGHFIVDVILVVHYTMIGEVVCRQHHARKSMKLSGNTPYSKAEISVSQATLTMEDLDKKPKPLKNNQSRPPSFLQFKDSIKKGDQRQSKKTQKKLMLELKQSLRSKTSTQSEKRGGKIHAGKTTLMLFLVTVGFILSFLPYSILVIIRYQDVNFYYRLSNSGKSVFQLFLRSYLFNSVLNPIVYCFVSKQFRQKSKEGLKSICIR